MVTATNTSEEWEARRKNNVAGPRRKRTLGLTVGPISRRWQKWLAALVSWLDIENRSGGGSQDHLPPYRFWIVSVIRSPRLRLTSSVVIFTTMLITLRVASPRNAHGRMHQRILSSYHSSIITASKVGSPNNDAYSSYKHMGKHDVEEMQIVPVKNPLDIL